MNTGLELQDVSLSVGSRQLLSLSCTIAPGEVMTVMGASGTGKSTLLAFIAGFLNEAFTAEGRIVLENKALNSVPAEQRRIGLLFQDALLFPHLSVADNLKFGLVRTAGESRKDRDDRVEQALEA
ncbi:ATP-binding cassette domain-containing protein, partial [Gammaproteobacteria bacterium]|nr:ATP-binding cassette domain-containing protein [Gammaproteobacteria bacterium]